MTRAEKVMIAAAWVVVAILIFLGVGHFPWN